MVMIVLLQVLNQDFDFDFTQSSRLHVVIRNLVLILVANIILNNPFWVSSNRAFYVLSMKVFNTIFFWIHGQENTNI